MTSINWDKWRQYRIDNVNKSKSISESRSAKGTNTSNYKTDFLTSVAEYNSFGKTVYREDSLVDVAESLAKLAEKAEYYTLQEGGDWFDSVTIKRNMKELRTYSNQFKKFANEAQTLQERIVALYEDMGQILGRYYSLDELNEVENQEDDK